MRPEYLPQRLRPDSSLSLREGGRVREIQNTKRETEDREWKIEDRHILSSIFDPRTAILLVAFVLFVVSALPAHAGHGEEPVETIAPERVKFLLDNKEKIFFVDLRSPKEFQQKHLPGARSIPIAELEKRVAEIPRAGRVILYCACRAGDDSYAYFLLRDKGYTNVSVIDDGFDGWVRRKFPVEAGKR